ncbi:hypothetical protein DH2020_000263 [Rehmannia glutinosa]|uniref:Lactoylglutathione lyase n=1 Tax=Rehmannia glutinosa TaxID=99300 RepID=A0ABR0XW53_REHGL
MYVALCSSLSVCEKSYVMASSSLAAAFSRLRPTFHRPPLLSPLPILFTFKPKVFNQPGRFISATTVMASKESADNNPGLQASVDEATKGYFMQQTMLRVKDPKVSLDFYSRIMGMSLLKRLDFPEMKFSLYFLGYEDTSTAPSDPIERTAWTFGQKAVLELTHNWGTETDPDFKGYHNGNTEPVVLLIYAFSINSYQNKKIHAFAIFSMNLCNRLKRSGLPAGHIGITVDDVHKACKRFESLGVEFAKKPEDGKIKDIAFVKDPDGYWIEIFDTTTIAKTTANAAV